MFTSNNVITKVTAVPSEIANLYLWFDASDASTVTESGGAISAWADKSGNANHLTQGSASFKPTYTLAGQNGKNYISFDANDHLDSSSLTHDIGTGDYSIIFALRKAADAFGAWQGVASIGVETPAWRLGRGGRGTQPTISMSGHKDFATVLTQSTDYVVTFIRSSGAVSCWINSAADASNSVAETGNIANAAFRVGVGETEGFGGRMYECALYRRALTSTERLFIELGLRTKWGI